MTALGVLDRYVRRAHRASSASEEPPGCELCAQPVAEVHRHVVDLVDRRLLCACNACAVLFADHGGRRFRTVPERVRIDPSWALTSRELDALQIPVGLAFFFRPSKLGRWTVVFPSPGGATEAELPDGAFEAFEERIDPRGRALVRSIQDDVEALLVRRGRDGACTSFVVPIDVCYELIALLRRHWQGFDGGPEARRVVDEFFARLAERSEPSVERTSATSRFERARKIADAVLFEGYLLYPYRADATKNRYRWTFGVLAPRSWSEAGGCEPWWLEAQVLVETLHPRIRGRLRFLRVVVRRVEAYLNGAFYPVPELHVGERLLVPWEEGEVREIDIPIDSSPRAPGGEAIVPFSIPACEEIETFEDASGRPVGRVVRTRAAIQGAIRVQVHDLGGALPLSRVSVRVENLTPHPAEASRADAMHASLVSTHLLLASEDGAFVSVVDPPEHAREAAAKLMNVHTHPVLAGEPGTTDLVLCAPVILYDHPQISPESPGDSFDATEIDELLAMRTRTLTPEEKARARATDPRGAEVVDRAERLGEAALSELHATMKPRTTRFVRGQRVRIRKKADGATGTDAQDFLYEGLLATVEAVLEDVDGRAYLAVTIDDDPAAELNRWYGRFHHYYPDEVEPL